MIQRMQEIGLKTTVKTNEVRTQSRTDGEDPKMYRACRDFEALLVRQMLEEMQRSTPMFGKGFGGDFFQGIFQDEIAKEITAGHALGLADILYEQMMRARVKIASDNLQSTGCVCERSASTEVRVKTPQTNE
ncbi:MAG: rod-binding protein [Bacillota bacterium]